MGKCAKVVGIGLKITESLLIGTCLIALIVFLITADRFWDCVLALLFSLVAG